MGANLKQFPYSVGISMAIHMALLLLIASTGIFIISHIHIASLTQLALIFSVLIPPQVLIYMFAYRKIFDPKKEEAA